ncbi:dsRBD fold-containing protein [Streptomyces hydrogenans]|uniref:Uncharacterized protein n=1 Tax=Streptomyces hydrogenans TaxID=1873719 RepID=A0ABQ3PJF0_9ACTN|nr:dsRBD fold-containing protein [Streptomyces hydrogenans]GHF94540.1 hypothetical protein GCM10018784_02760 [Streptomyces hydrogenans]GHI25150.1 hypothetical protein Shyd_65210 [Streptomyces hydrogenans]
MAANKDPYVRPGELGSNELTYTLRVVADGTRTVVEVYDTADVQLWTRPVGVGRARRRKGDRRDSGLGTSLALARALKDASDNAFSTVEDAIG